jgi:hypothetical protein
MIIRMEFQKSYKMRLYFEYKLKNPPQKDETGGTNQFNYFRNDNFEKEKLQMALAISFTRMINLLPLIN